MVFLAGLALLVFFVLLGRGYVRANPKSLAKGFRYSAGALLILLTIALFATREIAFAFLTGAAAWYVLFGTVAPWYRFPGGPGPGNGNQQGRRPHSPARNPSMSRSEAFKVLGLEEGASEAEIRAAHRRLIQQTHPDKGGTSYLAAKINEAKDVLLKG
jgi:hypothetical protein